MFPETPQTLLRRIADLPRGEDEAEWTRFVELYTPPLRSFIREVNANLAEADVEDAVEDVFVRLVEVLRRGAIDRTRGRFRSYLATMTRRLLIDRYRAELVRPRLTGAEGALEPAVGALADAAPDPGAMLDLKWRLACHRAAVEHVLSRPAISAQSREIYCELVGCDARGNLVGPARNASMKEVASRHGLTYDAVKQVKSRLDRAIAALEQFRLRPEAEDGAGRKPGSMV